MKINTWQTASNLGTTDMKKSKLFIVVISPRCEQSIGLSVKIRVYCAAS